MQKNEEENMRSMQITSLGNTNLKEMNIRQGQFISPEGTEFAQTIIIQTRRAGTHLVPSEKTQSGR